MEARLNEIDEMQTQIAQARRETRQIAEETQIALDRLKDLLPDSFHKITNTGQQ
jgi:hypothetical protein